LISHSAICNPNGEIFMALLTRKEYLESLKEFSPEIYIRGERV
jgi:hypothetical protein